MSRQRISPSRLLLLCWVAWAGVAALAVGKAVAGVCTVMSYPAESGFAVGFSAAWVLGALLALAHFLSLRYTLDGHFLTKASGVFWRHRRSISLDKITSISVRQGPIEQLLRFGQVWIHTPSSGSDVPEDRLLGVRDPQAVKDAIVRLTEAELPATAQETEDERRDLIRLLEEIRDGLSRLEAGLAPDTPALPPPMPAPAPPEACPPTTAKPPLARDP